MMKNRKITYSFAQGEVEGVLAALKAILEKYWFLQPLTSKERMRMIKQGAKRTGFVKDSNMVVEGYPEIIPASEIENYKQVVNVYDSLQQLSMAFAAAAELFNHTALVAGSDAMKHCLRVYRYAKAHANEPGMRELLERLSVHFKKSAILKEDDATSTEK